MAPITEKSEMVRVGNIESIFARFESQWRGSMGLCKGIRDGAMMQYFDIQNQEVREFVSSGGISYLQYIYDGPVSLHKLSSVCKFGFEHNEERGLWEKSFGVNVGWEELKSDREGGEEYRLILTSAQESKDKLALKLDGDGNWLRPGDKMIFGAALVLPYKLWESAMKNGIVVLEDSRGKARVEAIALPELKGEDVLECWSAYSDGPDVDKRLEQAVRGRRLKPVVVYMRGIANILHTGYIEQGENIWIEE